MYTFKYRPVREHHWQHLHPVAEVKLKVHEGANLEDMCDAFTDFLRGCGYRIDGRVEIVSEEEESDVIPCSEWTCGDCEECTPEDKESDPVQEEDM